MSGPSYTMDPFIVERLREFEDAQLCGDDDRAKDEFLHTANRCAQALLYLKDKGITIPDESASYWDERQVTRAV